MAVTGIGSNCSKVYESTYAAKKNETAGKTDAKEATAEQAGDAKKAETDSVSDYYSYLQKNYDCVKNGSVAVSGSYLKKCAKNPGKAEELEANLSFFKEGYESGLKSAQANARAIGAKLVNYSENWSIDSTGNITMMASTTVTSDNSTKGWKELAEEQDEKRKEKKEKTKQDEKAKEKKAEKQELLDKLQENMQKKMEETGRKQFGSHFKSAQTTAKNEENMVISKKAGILGTNMDLKI